MKLILLSAFASSALLGADNIIKWHSQGLTVVPEHNIINLDADVEIRQGNVLVQAEHARIHLSDQEMRREAVTKVVLRGNVRFSFVHGQKKITGQAEHAKLLPLDSITLSGRAQITQGGNVLRGKKIIYYLLTGWIKVEEAEGVIRSAPPQGEGS